MSQAVNADAEVPEHNPRLNKERCPCSACRHHRTERVRRHRLRKARGEVRVVPEMPPELVPVRKHLKELVRGGMKVAAIARAAGQRTSLVHTAVYGQCAAGRASTQEILDCAGALMGVELKVEPRVRGVKAIRVQRMLRAMYSWGVSQIEIAKGTGISRQYICALICSEEIASGAPRYVRTATYAAVCGFYEQVCQCQEAEADRELAAVEAGCERGDSLRQIVDSLNLHESEVRIRAAALGWSFDPAGAAVR